MALNFTNMGQEIKDEFDALTGDEIYTPLAIMQAQSKAVITHFQNNAEINSSVTDSFLSGSQTIPSNSETVANFSGSNFTSGILSGIDSGIYQINVRISFSDLTAGCSEIYAYIKKNSTSIDFDRCPLINEATLKLSKTLEVVDSDQISVVVYQNHSTNNHYLSSDHNKTYFTYSKIGDKIS